MLNNEKLKFIATFLLSVDLNDFQDTEISVVKIGDIKTVKNMHKKDFYDYYNNLPVGEYVVIAKEAIKSFNVK